MDNSIRRAAQIVALGLIVSVVTQLLYMALLAEVGIVEGWPLRSTIWTVEVVLFALVAVAGFAAMAGDSAHRIFWSAVALSGVFNAVQGGIGLSMFLPATQAGEEFAPLMGTVLAGAFLFYFLAKALLGLAALLIGTGLFGASGSLAKTVGAAAALSGLAAIGLNVAAMHQGMSLVFQAGAAGTAATLFVAIAILLRMRGSAQ